MRFILIALLTLVLAGCPFVKTEYEVRPVPVPVVIHSEVDPPEIEEMKPLPIYDLTKESSDEEVAIAIDKSIVILESYKKELLEAIRPYQEASRMNKEVADEIAQQAVSRVQEAIDRLLAREKQKEEQ